MKCHPFNRIILSEVAARKIREREKSVAPVKGNAKKVKGKNVRLRYVRSEKTKTP